MSGSRPTRAVPTHRLWWWLGGAAVIGLVIAVVAVSAGWGVPTPPASASPSPTSISASPSVSVSATASPTPTPSDTPSATPSVTPSPSATRTVDKAPYCRAFAQIKTRPVSANSEDGGVDFDALADRFSALIKVYSQAAKAAPSSLDRQYAVVLAYLKDMRAAVVSRDLDGIKQMITNLDLLNQYMAAIQRESEQICG